MASCAKRLLAVLPLLLFLAAPVRAQTTAKVTQRKTAAQPANYPDSADGLKLFLQDVLASGKLGGSPKMAAFVDAMRIPDYENWFPKAFGKETGDSWSKTYEGSLDFLNIELQGMFIRLAEQNLEIVTRKVTGAPESDAEQRVLQLFQEPVDVFFAASKPRPGATGDSASASDALATPLGYFWFIDGNFRWDPMNPIGTFSMAVLSRGGSSSPGADSPAAASASGPAPPGVLQPGQDGVGYPSCLECPAPVYTAAALDARFQGTVELRVVIQADGTATDIQVVQGAPYDLDANAIDTVKHWRFNPAIDSNGKAVAVVAPIEVTYALGPASARSPSPSASLIEKAREAAFEFSDKLPNFICEEFMARFTQRDREAEMPVDVVSAELIYTDAQESYRNVKINDRPTDKKLEEIGGSWSTGEFASTLVDLFHPDTDAQFRSGGASSISGFSAEVYDFEVRRENSHWMVHSGSQTFAPAYGGSVWVDPKTARVLRIEMQARNIPSDFPMDRIESAVDYSYVTIGGTSFLLPVHAESLGCERGTSNCSHNKIDFRNYHEYKVDIKIGN